MLPGIATQALNESLQIHQRNTGLNLVMALSYIAAGGNWVQAVRHAEDVKAGKIDPVAINRTYYGRTWLPAIFPILN